MKTIKTASAAILLSAYGVAFSGIDDYELRRLPISVGNEFSNSVGDTRQFIPTSINNNGLMAGTRLTWRPDGNGDALSVTNQASYIYDLESRAYLASPIAGMAITFIGDTDYIGKKLHSNGLRWQTWRCPISGLVEDVARGVWTNPACVLIDNDYLDQDVAAGDWAGFFVFGNFYRAANDLVKGSNSKASSLVMDLPDDFDGDELETTNYYKSDGTVKNSVELSQDPMWESLGDAGSNGFSLFSFENGHDVFYVMGAPDSSVTPGKVYRAEVGVSDFNLSVTETEINWVDIGTGEYVAPLAVNESLDVFTTHGVCNLYDGCSTKQSFAAEKFFPVNSSSTNFIFDDEVVVSETCAFGSACAPDLYFYDIETDSEFSFSNKVFQKFSEDLDLTAITYAFPGFLAVAKAGSPGIMRFSRNGKYIVVVARDVGGLFRNYIMKRGY